jgi:hypothetical protein
VTSSERTVHAWPGGKADLTCIVKAEPRATVRKEKKKDRKIDRKKRFFGEIFENWV